MLLWKQEILASFLTDFMQEIGRECREKADILLFVWNSVFNIIEYLVEISGRISQKEEKQHLSSIIGNHKDYQSVIEKLKQKMARREQNYQQQEEFIKALIYNLRYKRKEITKMSKNMKLCTMKINEIKDFYIDLQVEHIELLSENRDISKENALNLFKRKQELNHERRKQYQMKQTRKKLRFHIEGEIHNEDLHEAENVTKLNQDLKSSFNKFTENKKRKISEGKVSEGNG